jgi:hypothetical protein
MPATEGTLKPYILIRPKTPGDWSDKRKIDFSNALVDIDPTSARELDLNLSDSRQNLRLLPFLRKIAPREAPKKPGKQQSKVEF